MSAFHRKPSEWTGRSDPEDGDLARRVFNAVGETGSLAILGFACDAGVKRNKGRPGAKEGPAAIRKSLSGIATPLGFEAITDLGDVVVDGDALENGHKLLAEHISNSLPGLKRLVVLGGGHETAFGSFSGLRAAYPDKSIGIVNFDAHFDLRKPADAGPSSGTPFYQIHNLDPKGFDYLCLGVARESNTEALFARAADLKAGYITDKDMAADIASARLAITDIAARNDLIYLTIDIDLLPHYQAPGVSAPAARGVPLKQVEELVDHLLASATVPLADIVEVSPPYDRDNMTAKTAAFLALKLLSG